MSYRRQTRIAIKEPVSPVITHVARVLEGIFDEFGINADQVQFERVSAQVVRCTAAELPGQINLSLNVDRVTLSVPNTVCVAL